MARVGIANSSPCKPEPHQIDECHGQWRKNGATDEVDSFGDNLGEVATYRSCFPEIQIPEMKGSQQPEYRARGKAVRIV